MVLLRRRRREAREYEFLPDFSEVSEIGVGSLAVVFRAHEIGANRHVALKLLNVRAASPRALESFERESIALGALSSHPNIVTLYRSFRTRDGRPVLVLELCTGAVSDRLGPGAGLQVAHAVSIGVKIAGALETAHRAGILHGNVQPQSILITDFGEPALTGFGVAMLKLCARSSAGLFDFTTLHAAPELLEGGSTSPATDVYELASSLYQLIAGHPAFRAYEGESPASVILRILRDPVRPLSGVDVPMALSDLLVRAMSKAQDERPQTAADFAAALTEIEITQRWHPTQFLVRDAGPLGSGLASVLSQRPAAGARTPLPTHAQPPTHALPEPIAREVPPELAMWSARDAVASARCSPPRPETRTADPASPRVPVWAVRDPSASPAEPL